MSIQTFLKRPYGLLRIPGNTHPITRPNHVSGSKPCVGLALLSHTVLQTQSRLCTSSIMNMNIRSLATFNGPHQIHSTTATHRLDTQQSRGKSSWTKRYPEVHYIQVKNMDKSAVWGDKFEAITTTHRDEDRRAIRVWTPFPGGSQSKEALRVKWPKDEQAAVERKLRDGIEKWFDGTEDDGRFFTVTEKVDGDGRLFWKEVIPEGGSTGEEDFWQWEEGMEKMGIRTITS